MQTSIEGLAEIAGHEGIVLSPYLDSVGVWTIFVGHTAAADSPPDPAALPKGVEQPIEVALDVFRRDMRKYEREVSAAVKVPVSQTEFDALVSFHFNTGGINRAALVRHLNNGDRRAAIAAFDSWHKPPEIIGRRDKEKALFARGVYAHGGKALLSPADERGRVQYSKGRNVDILSILRAGRVTPVAGPTVILPASPSRPQPDEEAPIPRPRPDPAPAPSVGTVGGVVVVGGAGVVMVAGNAANGPDWLIWVGAGLLALAFAYGAFRVVKLIRSGKK